MTEENLPRVLCLDDEQRVLEGLENQLCFEYQVESFTAGDQALARLDTPDAPHFDVIISDMRMPGMDGATFLKEAHQRTPDVVRILLTGHSDLDDAAAAVNKGHIYRFLQKPCDPDQLMSTVAAGVRQTALQRAEREILHGTLNGTVRLLVDVLGIVSPAAFRTIGDVRDMVMSATETLGLEVAWEIEAAASLYRLGAVTMPDDVVLKGLAGQALSGAEGEMFLKLGETSARFLDQIPRLSGVARIIRRAHEIRFGMLPKEGEDARAAWLVAAAEEIDMRVCSGKKWVRAKQSVCRSLRLPPELTAALTHHTETSQGGPQFVQIEDLTQGMTLDSDVLSKSGQPLVRKGTQVSPALIARLENFAANQGVQEPLQVRWSAEGALAAATAPA